MVEWNRRVGEKKRRTNRKMRKEERTRQKRRGSKERRGNEEVSGCKQRLTACARGAMTLIKNHPALPLAVTQSSFMCLSLFNSPPSSCRFHGEMELPLRTKPIESRGEAEVSVCCKWESVFILCPSVSPSNLARLRLSHQPLIRSKKNAPWRNTQTDFSHQPGKLAHVCQTLTLPAFIAGSTCAWTGVRACAQARASMCQLWGIIKQPVELSVSFL